MNMNTNDKQLIELLTELAKVCRENNIKIEFLLSPNSPNE